MLFQPIYLILGIFVFGMNIIPFFMPPTWVVLAYFYTRFHLSLIPTVLIGATMATLGRILLSLLARNYFRPFLPSKFEQNYGALGKFFQQNQQLTLPIIFTYAFLPIPSNDVFIIAGLARLPIRLIAFSFFMGRLISYTFWVSLAFHISTRLEGVFSQHFSNIGSILAEITGLVVIILVGRINWKKILKIKD